MELLKEVNMTKYFAALLILFVAWPSFAADRNGYTAQYECRASGPHCKVDVAALTAQSCQQTITTSDSAAKIDSKLNGAANVICVQNGDYTSQGTWRLTASGTSGQWRILRYTNTVDKNDEPWNQSSSDKAKIAGITVNANFWIIQRIALSSFVNVDDNANNVIFDRILAENIDGDMVDFHGSSDVTLQNSVVRNTITGGTSDKHCTVSGGTASNLHLVNNEIYNCQGDGYQVSPGSGVPGLVIENNDIYLTSAYYTQGGTEACAENALDLKSGGTSTSPVEIIHNRLWGHRYTDSSCADGSYGEEIIYHETNGSGQHNSYGLIQNNVIFDGTIAITSPNREAGGPDHWSIIGNLMYDFSGVGSGTSVLGLESTYTEAYLNTFIETAQAASVGWLSYNKSLNQDIRCNVSLDGGRTTAYGTGTESQIDHNVYYNTTAAAEPNKIVESIASRANSTTYSLNQIIRTASVKSCVNGTESACFLYKVTQAGTSAGSAPSYCTTLGCTETDGTVTLRAIRGPYTFYRKLRTGPETYTIPYARAYVSTTNSSDSAPEVNTCPSSYASRRGIGISDAQ